MKKFSGFSKDQMTQIAKSMGFDGPMHKFNEFLAASPDKASSLARMTKKARELVERGQGYATGGEVKGTEYMLDPATEKQIYGNPKTWEEARLLDPQRVAMGETDTMEKANVWTPDINKQNKQTVSQNVGKVSGDISATAETGTVATADKVDESKAATYNPDLATPELNAALKKTQAAKGEVSKEAQVEAAQGDPTKLAQLELEAAQAETVQVGDIEDRELQKGELINKDTVDMQRVNKTLDGIEAATADPSEQATVQGQMANLMEDFEDGTPAWAAGAIRQAEAAMAARGIGASSMAGMAILQASMESALPIAQADAATFASFEMQNLSNRQQVTMFAAEQRANFLGMKFDQDFQQKVYNASKITEIANKNYDTGVQVALENARLAQSTNLANLSAENAKVLADAAAMTQMDMANLDNRQQAAVQNAQSFLQMDLANLSNEQQTAMFKAQARVQTLLSDQAAKNASRQFNATSENQTNQFFANLAQQTEQFNATQRNSMTQFNTSELNAMKQFNVGVRNQREQFNAQNQLVIAQANAQWFQQLTTAKTEALNQANRDKALATNQLTAQAYQSLWQTERDLMAFAFTAGENDAQRSHEIVMQKIAGDEAKSNALWKTVGDFGATVVDNVFKNIKW